MASKTLLLICLVALLKPLWGVPLPMSNEADDKAEEYPGEDYPEMDEEVDMEQGLDDEEGDYNEQYDDEDYDEAYDDPADVPEYYEDDPEEDGLPEELYHDEYVE